MLVSYSLVLKIKYLTINNHIIYLLVGINMYGIAKMKTNKTTQPTITDHFEAQYL